MSAPTLERTAMKRVRRTRSRAVSALPALSVSTLRPHEYDLRPACISLVCPSCRTWVPINQPGTTRPKLVPHHMKEAGTEDPRRCAGSHRLVVLDMDIERWWQRLTEGVAETDGRRSNRVTRKPRVASAPAVMQMVAPLVSEKAARKRNEAHIRSCVTCRSAGCCADGRRLLHLAAHTRRTGPARRKADMQREEWQERREQGQRLLHKSQWAKAAGSVRKADIQRAHDALVAMLRPLSPQRADGPQLSDWERAECMSAITMLATMVEQLNR